MKHTLCTRNQSCWCHVAAETTQTDMIVTTVPLTTEVEQTDPPTTTPEAATISISTLGEFVDSKNSSTDNLMKSKNSMS